MPQIVIIPVAGGGITLTAIAGVYGGHYVTLGEVPYTLATDNQITVGIENLSLTETEET